MSVVARVLGLPGDTLKAKLRRLKIDDDPQAWVEEKYDTDELARPVLDRLLFGPDANAPLYRRLPRVPSYFVLGARFIRSEYKDLGDGKRLYFSDKTKDEDVYQGIGFMVIGVGPDAYRSDKHREWTAPNCRVGDWIVARDSWGWSYRKVYVASIRDDMVHSVVQDPRDAIENY